MNNALIDEPKPGMMDLGQFVKTVVFITLIILNVLTLVEVNNLQSQLDHVRNDISTKVSSTEYHMNNLKQEMKEYFNAQALIQNPSIELSDVSGDEYTYTIEFDLREINPGSIIYLLKTDSSNVTEKIQLSSTSLSYSANVTLQENQEYRFDVLVEGETITQDDLFTINLEDELKNSVRTMLFPTYDTEAKKEVIIVQIENTLSEYESKEINRVDITVFLGDEIVASETMTSPSDMSNYEEFYNIGNENALNYIVVLDEDDYDWSGLYLVCTITLADGTVIEISEVV